MRLVIESTRSVLRILPRHRRWKWLLLVVMALTVALFEAIGAGLIFTLINFVSPGADALVVPFVGDLRERFPATSERALQIGAVAGLGGFFVVRGIFLVVQEYVRARVVQNAGAQVAQRLILGYLALPYLFHTTRNSSDLVRNTFDSTQRLVKGVLTPLVHIFSEAILVLGLTVVLLVVSPIGTIIALAGFTPVVLLLQSRVQPRLKSLGRRSQAARSASLKALQQALEGYRDIKLLGRERHFARQFERQRAEVARTDYVKAALAAVPRSMIETALVLIIAAIFMVAVLVGEGFEGAVATLGVFAYVGLRLQPSLQKIVNGANELRYGSAVLEDIVGDLTRFDDTEPIDTEEVVPLGFAERVALHDVGFAYTSEGPAALTGINLEVRVGEFLGICGPTGGGKSTLVDVIAGLLRPTSGTVQVDGVDIAGQEPRWHRLLGMVSQNVFLIDDTLRANIAFGVSEDRIDEGAVLNALRRSQLEEVVAELPQGLDTKVGERGVRLSGGQRQRVAIARALYRGPPVIIFDEATSALDSATEAALVAALDEARTGRTLISVAHRITTLKNADRIIVVANGRIVSEGRYETLLTESPMFQALAR